MTVFFSVYYDNGFYCEFFNANGITVHSELNEIFPTKKSAIKYGEKQGAKLYK